MSGYCNPIKPAALFGDTNLASSVPNRSRNLTRSKIPCPLPRLSRETLPDPAVPPKENPVGRARPIRPSGPTRQTHQGGYPSSARSDTSSASSLAPSTGPVYLEGRLVLSLSFRLENPSGNHVRVPEGEPLLERYRIWDDAAKGWLAGGPCVLRFESVDVVMSTYPHPAIAWAGALDVRLPVIGVPDLDESGESINRAHRLRWRREAQLAR